MDLLDTTEERQSNLLNNYYFLCDCSICKDTEHLKYVNSAICPNELCDSLIDMSNVKSDTEVHCTECKTNVNNEFIGRYNNIVEFTSSQLQEMKNIACILLYILLEKH